jgi:membrane-bound serine protease (ClpP class)
MSRSRRTLPFLAALAVAIFAAGTFGQEAEKSKPKAPTTANQGQFFPIVEPIDHGVLEPLEASVIPYLEALAAQGERPILVFEFRSGDQKPGASPFGATSDLADFLVHKLRGAKKTVAYVPEALQGYAVMDVLACDEIVLGPEASLGPISPPGENVTPARREALRELARNKGREADLLVGMLDPEADLREVQTVDRQHHFVLAENLNEFRKTHQVVEDHPAWEGPRRGVLSPQRARRGLARLIAEDRAEVAKAYELPSTSDDPTLGGPINPLVIQIKGRIDTIKESYLLRRINQAAAEKVNLIIFEMNSPGGLVEPAQKVARAISDLKGVKTVAFLNDRALGAAALIPLACDRIAFGKNSRLGNITQQLVSESETESIDEDMRDVLAKVASKMAEDKGHPGAVVKAMVDPRVLVSKARDKATGAVVYVTNRQIDDEPARYEVLEVPKSAEEILTLDDKNARDFGMSNMTVRDFDELQTQLGLRGRAIRRDSPTWVDGLVSTLNTSWMKGLLLFVGFFMLVLELKLPGIGLPAILSALAFLLYFWSSYLGGTADQLEIMLFVVGLICLGLELFVFPGYGVFGMSGVLLVLVSVVMASHTFVWPTQEYEYKEMGKTLIRILVILFSVLAGAVAFGRYFPSLPFFNRMVLKADAEDADALAFGAKPLMDADPALTFLLGETGRTTTVLRPIGKARFGELLVEVTADGAYIEPDRLVEVVEVHGSRVIVKAVG